MKSFATILAIIGAASALATPQNANQTSAGTKLKPVTPAVVAAAAKPTATPFYFNLLSSDGNYLGQEYGGNGAFLTANKSGYIYQLFGTTLQSSSSDILQWFGSDGTVEFSQPGNADPLTCAITGKYPTFGFNCGKTEKGAGFGNYGGELVFGTKASLKSYGATPITFTVEPFGPSDCST